MSTNAAPIFAMCLFFLFSGCAQQYPMGLSKSQWHALSPQQQADYQVRQYEVDEQRRRDSHDERLAKEQAIRERSDVEQERLDRVYASAAYGDIVRVAIQDGVLDIYGKSKPAQPAAFEIAKGERKAITITQEGQIQQSFDFPVTLSSDGQTLTFNDGSASAFVMVNRNWERGESYTMPASARQGRISLLGARVFVRFKETADAPQRVIIEHR